MGRKRMPFADCSKEGATKNILSKTLASKIESPLQRNHHHLQATISIFFLKNFPIRCGIDRIY